MANSISWKKIFDDYKILNHDFNKSPFPLSAMQIKRACQKFKETGEKEVRILCKQDSRESRPDVFKKHNLFLLPVKNGYYNIIKSKLTYQPVKELEFIASYTYNENRYTTGLDDNINHAGFETTYKPMDKLSFWLKYAFSRVEDVYKQQQFGGSDFYESHHNFFLGSEYKFNPDSSFTFLYGEYAGYSNPYQQSTWTLSTLDTQHIFRLIYKRKF